MVSQSLTCDNSLGINLIEASLREADHTAVGVLYIWLTCINLPTPNAMTVLLYWQQQICTGPSQFRPVILHT